MIKLVLTDLDNTLIAHEPGAPFDEAVITDEGLAAIRALLDAGVHFGPSTGRGPASMAQTFRDQAWAYASGAYANGQLIYVDNRVAHEEWCSAEVLQRVADIVDEQPYGIMVIFNLENDQASWGVSRNPEKIAAYSGRRFVSRVEPCVTAPSMKTIIRMGTDVTNTPILRNLLAAEVPELDFVMPSPNAAVIDITPKGYGKGDGVRIMAETLGIDLDEVAVFGDADNDLSMLQAVPNSIAVANASEAAAAAARWHIGDACEQSVAKAMAEIAEASARGELPAFMR